MTAAANTACQRDPDRWFTRRDRRYAVEQCLTCPLRRQCASLALTARPKFGMWAGIWIERNFTQAEPRLQAIASPAGHRPMPPSAPALPAVTVTKPDAAHLIAARASGHCEIMAPGCRYSLEELTGRVPGDHWRERNDPAGAYAVCHTCKATLAITDPALTHRLGYVVDSPTQLRRTPFFWRQTRWVLFEETGRVCDSARPAA